MIGEVGLRPTTGGRFYVEVERGRDEEVVTEGEGVEVERVMLWDRKRDGGFPETKVLKQRVRDVVQPERSLGHSDRGDGKAVQSGGTEHSAPR